MGIFSALKGINSETCRPILLNFELGWDFMVVQVTCKYEEDPIKNGREKLETRFSLL